VSDRFMLDPNAVLDFAFSWTNWLGAGETITSAVVTVPTGLTKASQSTSSGVVTVWLSNGVPSTTGRPYPVTCHITTNAGRQDDRTIRIDVRDR
jgi:hypothetical protein